MTPDETKQADDEYRKLLDQRIELKQSLFDAEQINDHVAAQSIRHDLKSLDTLIEEAGAKLE